MLVSEFMLQQTQVDRVVPRFVRFVEKFPSLATLAASREEEVVAEWSGLGYYRRARMFHRLAREVVGDSGALPRTVDGLEELPGIGPYTAAAVASMAFGEAAPVLDGNTLRVGSRNLARAGDPRTVENRRLIGDWILDLMQGEAPGRVNEALMELGAVVCTPREPACDQCPLADGCKASIAGNPEAYPPPRRRRASVDIRWVAACCIDTKGRWLLHQIGDGPILEGLWLPPLAELDDETEAFSRARGSLPFGFEGTPVLGPVGRHNITHRKIEVLPVGFVVSRSEQPSGAWRWVDPKDPQVPTSSLLQKLVDSLGR